MSQRCQEQKRGKVEADRSNVRNGCSESARLPRGAAVLDRIELFQLGVGAFASGRRATKILEVHSSTVSRL